jgi:hypothetical protein
MEEHLKDHATAIGHLTIAFNSIERQISHLIGTLLGDSYVGEIVTAPLPFPKKVDVLGALAQHKIADAELLDRLKGLITRLESINTQRNGFIHAEWWVDYLSLDEPESVGRRRSDIRMRQLRVRHDAPSAEEITVLVAEMRAASDEVDAVDANISAAVRG